MRRYVAFALGGILCCSLAVMAGCSSSKLVDIWTDSSYREPSLYKILVISVGKNPVQRRIWEDAYCDGLATHSVVAIPSYRLFPDAVPDTSQVNETVRSKGFDGILINRRLPSITETKYVQGYVANEQTTRYDRRRDKFVSYYREVEHVAYVDSQIVDIRAIDVWATKDEGQMIWSATSNSPEPNSSEVIRTEIVNLVMADLAKHRIIASKQ